MQVKVDGAEALTTLIATPNHPFWVENVLVEDDHWLATECLEPGQVLQLADGRKASVHAAGKIRRTQLAHIGFAADDRAGVGMVLDLSEKQIKLASDDVAHSLGQLDLGEPYLTPVHNFEVDDFHTYYVGEVGVWVHNSNCTAAEALEAAGLKAEMEGACFPGDTTFVLSLGGIEGKDGFYVSPIGEMQVGEYVWSRCEVTGETAYKRVTKVFNHGFKKVCVIGCTYGAELYKDYSEQWRPTALMATAEHPFWVEGKGWTKVSDLQPGDEFVTYNGVKATCRGVELDAGTSEVFNLEVEDFHTYFVGDAGIWVHNKNAIEFNRLSTTIGDRPRLFLVLR